MKFHDTLNDKIWDLNTEDLIPEVKEKLEEIAEAFIEFLEIPTDAVLDKVITGSSASYNYNKFSDLDLHIIVDYDKVHEDCPLVNGYLNSLKKQFNDNHDITIHGVPVELYAEQKDQGTVHNGLYSLQTGWIDKPQKIAPTDNDAAVEAKYNEIKELVDKCDDSEEATELLEKIYNMRKAGLAEAGEFCTENLAFKKLRNEGCMDKLRKIKKEQIDKQLSLESYNENNTLKDIIDRLISIGLQIDGSYKDYKPSEVKYAKEVMDIAVKKGFVFKEEDQYKKEISQSFAKLRYDLLNDKQVIEIANKAKKDIDKQLSLESYNETLEQDVKELTTTDDYYKVDGSRVSIKNGFGSQVELMDLQNLGKKLEKKGYKVYCSNYYIDAKKNESVNEKLEEKEYQGCKYTILPDGKYCSIRIYAPKGYSFRNGDTWYSTEAELKNADKKAKDIIDNGIELKESIKETLTSGQTLTIQGIWNAYEHGLVTRERTLQRYEEYLSENNMAEGDLIWAIGKDKWDHLHNIMTGNPELDDDLNESINEEKEMNEDYTDIKPNTKQFDIVDRDGYSIDTLYVTPLENGHFDYWTDQFDSVSEVDTLKDIIDDVKECHDNGPGAEKVKIVGLNKRAFKAKNESIKEGFNKGDKVQLKRKNNKIGIVKSIFNGDKDKNDKNIKYLDVEFEDGTTEGRPASDFKKVNESIIEKLNKVLKETEDKDLKTIWDEEMKRDSVIDTPDGPIYLQPSKDGKSIEFGTMTNNGIIVDGSVEYDFDYSLNTNLDTVYDEIRDYYELYLVPEEDRDQVVTDEKEDRLSDLFPESKNEDVATLTDKVDKAHDDLKDLIKSLSNKIEEALSEPIEIGTRVGTPDGQVTGTVKEVNTVTKEVKIETDEVPGKPKEEKTFKIDQLDNIIKEALQ